MRCNEEKITLTTSRLLGLPFLWAAVLPLKIALLAVLASLVLPAYGVVLIDAATPTTLYATLNDRELYKSTDGGMTWTDLDYGSDSPAVWRLFLAPQTPPTLYALAGQGRKNDLLKSSDDGRSWTFSHLGSAGLSRVGERQKRGH